MAAEWDDFVRRSRQPSMLLLRGYMDYHAHRFTDASLVARTGRGRPVAMLPAECSGATVGSHRGLTYGGWITPQRHFYATTMLDVMEAMRSHYRERGFTELIYKPIPHIYCTTPADEDLYALFRLGATMTGCALSATIELHRPRIINESTRQGVTLARRSGVRVEASERYDLFWDILTRRLAERHSATPAHTLEEMRLLAGRFPQGIALRMAYIGDEPVAGAVIYMTAGVTHTQYLATTARGREVKALALLIEEAIGEAAARGDRYFDFGSSTEQGGAVLNGGLMLQKSGHGARALMCPVLRLEL